MLFTVPELKEYLKLKSLATTMNPIRFAFPAGMLIPLPFMQVSNTRIILSILISVLIFLVGTFFAIRFNRKAEAINKKAVERESNTQPVSSHNR